MIKLMPYLFSFNKKSTFFSTFTFAVFVSFTIYLVNMTAIPFKIAIEPANIFLQGK